MPATLCPFNDDHSIDEIGLRGYVRHLASIDGIIAFVFNGRTDEDALMGMMMVDASRESDLQDSRRLDLPLEGALESEAAIHVEEKALYGRLIELAAANVLQ